MEYTQFQSNFFQVSKQKLEALNKIGLCIFKQLQVKFKQLHVHRRINWKSLYIQANFKQAQCIDKEQEEENLNQNILNGAIQTKPSPQPSQMFASFVKQAIIIQDDEEDKDTNYLNQQKYQPSSPRLPNSIDNHYKNQKRAREIKSLSFPFNNCLSRQQPLRRPRSSTPQK
ncbi:hypothetical protein ABPG72_013583 [Tetrahymena utriculariae]